MDVAPTNVVHGDGADLDVEAGDFGRRVHQNICNLGEMRGRVGKSDLDVIDDRSVPVGIRCQTCDCVLITLGKSSCY